MPERRLHEAEAGFGFLPMSVCKTLFFRIHQAVEKIIIVLNNRKGYEKEKLRQKKKMNGLNSVDTFSTKELIHLWKHLQIPVPWFT